jgi:hypothetical protein
LSYFALDRIELAKASLRFWDADPLPKFTDPAHPHNVARLTKGEHTLCATADQTLAVYCPASTVIMEGGNQSGKTRSSVLMVVKYALEQLPNCRAGEDVNIWYTTTTFDKFAEQAWGHFKSMLLWPDECITEPPTHRVVNVDWLRRFPETPQYFAIKRPSGALAHVYVHTYAQGRKEFQAQSVDLAVLDEECDEEIFREVQARMLARKGARLIVSCTPIEGEPWLDRLRQAAEETDTTKHFRFKSYENPACNDERIAELRRMYADVPEELALRLEGIPWSSSGLVYSERVFTRAHVVDPFPIDSKWTLNRCIDAGFRYPACVWIAVRNDSKQVIVYRAWKGHDMSVAEAAAAINRLSGSEQYRQDLIDPEVMARTPETGEPEYNLWRKHGIYASPAYNNAVRPGIEKMWQLMAERVETPDGKVPRFRVFNSCTDWLDERRRYKMKAVPENKDRDVKGFGVIKRDDHLMDPTRLLVLAGLEPGVARVQPPPAGSMAREFYDQRHKSN